MINFVSWMEAIKPLRDQSDIKKYHTRWMIKRDIPKVIQLAKSHPDFADIHQEEGEEGVEKALHRILHDVSNQVGIVATDKNEEVVGALIYGFNPGNYSIPFIVGESPDITYWLIHHVKSRLGNKNRHALYIQSHLDDPHTLQSMRDHGMTTSATDDTVHGRFPANAQHTNINNKYYSALHGMVKNELYP